MPCWTCPTHPHATLLGLFLLLTPPITAQQPPPWSTQANPNYNSPMATALIVMIIVFFTVGFLSVYLRHVLACLGFYPRDGTRRGRGGGWTGREAPRGLDPTVVNTFPTFLYSDVKIHRVGKTTPLECAICLSEFADHELLRLLPKCNHVFHPHCVDPWLTSHVTCPVCRANLEKIHHQPHATNTIPNNNNPFDHHLTSEDEAESQPSDQNEVIVRLEGSPEIRRKSPTTTPPQEIMKGLSMSESGRLIRLPRSHSTGHSLVGDSDRFTLRLPDEVRNKLVNDNFNNYTSTCFRGLPGAIVSPRVGYRAGNVGCSGLPVKTDRWRFTMSPPFISRPNSPKLEVANSSNNNSNNNNNMVGGLLRSPKNLFRSIKSPNKSSLQRIVSCSDIGERSSDRLWANRNTQEL